MFRVGGFLNMGRWKKSWDKNKDEESKDGNNGEWKDNFNTPLKEPTAAVRELQLWKAVRQHALSHLDKGTAPGSEGRAPHSRGGRASTAREGPVVAPVRA